MSELNGSWDMSLADQYWLPSEDKPAGLIDRSGQVKGRTESSLSMNGSRPKMNKDHKVKECTWFFPRGIGPMWPGGPPNRVGPNPGTEHRKAKIKLVFQLDHHNLFHHLKVTTYSSLLLTNERGRPYIRWAWLGGSWKILHSFLESLHLVLHTWLKIKQSRVSAFCDKQSERVGQF